MLVWPLLRTLRAQGADVELISASSRVSLARRVLGVRGSDAERPEWTLLWRGPSVEGHPPRHEIDLVVGVGVNAAWIGAARQRFTMAEIVVPPGLLDREEALALQRRAGPQVAVPRFQEAVRPLEVVCHVGSGGGKKSWELGRWLATGKALADRGVRVRLVAGEVERELWTTECLQSFEKGGGRLLGSLDELVDAIAPAAVFVGADTGPSHLAAQLGVPTLALFGPTNPGVWSPLGPSVWVLAPAVPCPMDWLESGAVADAVESLLGTGRLPLHSHERLSRQ